MMNYSLFLSNCVAMATAVSRGRILSSFNSQTQKPARCKDLGRYFLHKSSYTETANGGVKDGGISWLYSCSTADKQLFNRILNQREHVLYPLLPPPSASQYNLRHRPHNSLLCQRASRLTDCNFIIRMLYSDMY